MGKLFKILVWGKNGVGKTSLIEQLASGRVDDKVDHRDVHHGSSRRPSLPLAIS